MGGMSLSIVSIELEPEDLKKSLLKCSLSHQTSYLVQSQEVCKSRSILTLDHPLYSPDLPPLEFFPVPLNQRIRRKSPWNLMLKT